MPKTLWNEGRVTGLSIFEIYLRYLATEAPDVPPASEKEFMSSMITMGNSMLLKVGTDSIDGVHHRDIPLPSSSRICAANTIIGSFFAGSGAVSSNDDSYTGWATRVIDYGPLIENNSSSSPSGSTIPPTNTAIGDIPDYMKAQIPEYMKIIDGIVLQPGTWSVSDIQPPQKDFRPDMNEVPIVRISFKDKVEKPFFLLLTGFSNKLLTQALSGTETSLDTDSASDGDFLGPWVYPWANKIIFSIPPMFSDYMSSVDIATEDMAALQLYNTRYIWLYRMGEGSGAPTQADLADTRSLYQLQGVVGSVSDYFIDTYCVNYATVMGACTAGHLSDGYQTQLSCVNQIVDTYGQTAAENDYVYFLWSNLMFYDDEGQQGIFIPINLKNKIFSIALTKDNITMQVDHGINFSSSSITVDSITVAPTSTDIMGSLYGRTGADAGSEVDSDGNYIFQHHPILHEAVKEFPVFTRANTSVPLPPSVYNDQFVEWFSSTPVTSILSSETIQAMGLHTDYASMDFQSFLQYAVAQRDLTAPLSESIGTLPPIEQHYYIYTKADIEAVADPSFTWSTYITAHAMAKAELSAVEYYKPADLLMKAITVTVEGSAGSRTATYTVDSDITATCTNSNYHRWASVATSTTEQTKALSLIDDFGSPLPVAGSSGSINADVIRWADLLDALNQNKSLNILGGLLNIKNSGTNYIQLGTQRLYISTAAPTGTIPDRSLGIGWGSGIYTYTAGAWSAVS